MKNKQTGITLIALVITIILLLILAGITINSLGGENGLLAKAKWSAYVSEYESVAEAKELYRTEKEIDKYLKETIQYEMYPVDSEKPLENSNISETLKKAIMDLEGLKDNEINDVEKVNLYQVDFSKIDAEAKKDYVINIINGNLYSLQYEEYNGNFYHTPRLGVAIIENKMEEVGNYEIIVDAGDTVSWASIQIAYKEFVENSLTCKIYTSDDEVNWKEQNLELVNHEGQIEKYNISTADNSQFLKIQVEIKSVDGNNSKVDYVMTNFYKFRDTGIVPEVTVEGAQKQNGVYSIPTPSDGQTEATGTASVVQKIVVPENGEFLLELEDVYGSPNTTVKITKADGTEETINVTDTNKISVPAGATVQVTTQLEAGDGIGEIKVLKKDNELSQKKIEDNTKTESGQAGWVTVEQNQYVYNNGGTGFWEKCLVNNVEVDETGIIIESEDAVKRIQIRYQVSNGITWSSTFTNIQDAQNTQYLKVIVEYQVIEGNEYGDTSNNKIKVILNDGSWKATFLDEDGTVLFNKYAYFTNSSKQVDITLPEYSNYKEGKAFVGWKIDDNVYGSNKTYTLTKDTEFKAQYCLLTTVKDENGNDQEAYAIATKEDFLIAKEIIENVDNNSNFKLVNNIELNSNEQYEFDENGKITFKETAQKYNSIGSTDNPYGGIFDGNGYEISGLNIVEENTKTSGLFGMVSQDGEINNIVIKNSYIYGSRVGACAGYNEGKIYRCKVQNTTVEGNSAWCGGIVAINNGNIIECASISMYVTGYAIGGIAGVNGSCDSRDGLVYNSTTGYIYRCYSTGYIGNSQIGGIASHNGVYGGEGYIYDCYSTAKLEDVHWAGSIVAVQSYQGRGGYIYNSYYLNTDCNFPSVVTPQYYGTVENSYSNDTTVTAAKLNGQSGTAWVNDTQNINNGYPILAWQIQ